MPRKGENIYRRKDGRWEGRYKKGHVDGKLRFGYVFGHSYRETKEKLLAAKIAWQDQCREEKQQSKTLRAISATWLSEAGSFLKESTVAKYREFLDYYILPTFGSKPVTSISDQDVESLIHNLTLYGGKQKRGLAPQTVGEVLRLLGVLKVYATRQGFTVQYSQDKLAIKRHRKALRVLNELEWKRLYTRITSEATPIHAGILLAMMTGIRIGELCALRWDDISLPERHLRIHQTLQRIRDTSGASKTRIIVTPPKSDSGNRIIPIPKELCEYLTPLRKAGTYVLTGEKDTAYDPKTVRRQFHAVLAKCGIAPVTFHTLRHTFATRCVEAGVDPKCLSVILGHADVSVTFNRYVHPTMATKRKNMEKFLEFSPGSVVK